MSEGSKTIAVDCKLLALTSGGIPRYFRPLLKALIRSRPKDHFILVSPHFFNNKFLDGLSNFEIRYCEDHWQLPNKLKKLLYNFITYPRFLKNLQADYFLGSYYDFLIPNFYKGRSTFFIYDLCYWKVPNCYSRFSIWYHKFMFHQNKANAQLILTISNSSLNQIRQTYPELSQRTDLVYCSFDKDWSLAEKDERLKTELVERLGLKNKKVFLYTGGIDTRKNIPRLIEGFQQYRAEDENSCLVITGKYDSAQIPSSGARGIIVTGFLSLEELSILYREIANGVVTVSLYEGFGLTTLEAKALGLPLLCSDLEVFREVVGDYPIYCDPLKVESIVEGFHTLAKATKTNDSQILDPRFSPEKNEALFVEKLRTQI